MDGFVLPEPDSPEMIDLICKLDRVRHDNATAWVLVLVDDTTGEVCQGYGPFVEPEQALVEAGEQERWWRENNDTEELGTFSYKIVPLWEPGE